MKNKSIEEIFRQKFSDLKIEPSERARQHAAMRIRKRGRIILYRRLAIAAGVLMIVTLGYLFLVPGNGSERVAQQNSGQETIPADNGEVSNLNGEKPAGTSGMEEKDYLVRDTESDVDREGKAGLGADNNLDHKVAEKELPSEFKRKETQKAAIAKSGDRSEPAGDKVEPAGETGTGNLVVAVEEKAEMADASVAKPPNDLAMSDQDPAPAVQDPVLEDSDNKKETVKITIEYIASGSGKADNQGRQNNVKELYTKIDKLVYPEAVLGDIRAFKDQLFALDFINEGKSETQNKTEK